MFQNLARKRSSFLSIPARLGIMLVLLTAVLIAMPTLVAHADEFIVDDTGDAGDSSPGDGTCDTGASVCTLRAAIEEANAWAGYDTVTIGATGSIPLSSQLEITSSLTISGPGAGSLSISGGTTVRVITVTSGVDVTILGVTIRDGSATDGAGIYNFGTLTLDASTVVSNSATTGRGGGIRNEGTLTVTHSAIIGNTSADHAGGIFNWNGTVAIFNTTVADNTSSRAGGGIYSLAQNGNASLTLENCTVSGNAANGTIVQQDGGGGLRVASANGYVATAVVTNCTISGNSAVEYGGGHRQFQVTGGTTIASFINCTINGNDADNGGGIYNPSGTVNIRNTIIADNIDNSGPSQPDCSGTLNSPAYSLIEDTTGCTLGGTPTNNITGRDPSLGPLADNGGDTRTHALLIGSPAIDAGTCAGAPTTDQRGVSHPQGTACDIGAYEAEAELAIVKTVDDNSPDPDQSITYEITVDNNGALTATNALISDTLPSGLTFTGPVTLDPPQGGATLAQSSSDLPTLASSVTVTPGHRITVTFAVTVNTGLAGGTVVRNTAAATSAEVTTPQTGSADITVNNVAPVAADDTPAAVDEDSTNNALDILANDTDLNDDSLTVSAVGVADQGGTVVNNTTNVLYTPVSDFFGTEVFTYTVSDGNGGFDTATVTVTVDNLNDPPVADDDTDTVDEDSSSNAIDVLANDSFAPDVGETLTVSAVGVPDQGGAVVNNTTNVLYTPVSDFFGTEVFTYTVSDGSGGFDTASVTVTVNNFDDPPVADDDEYSTDEDTPLNVPAPGVLDGDTDPDMATLFVKETTGTLGLVFVSADGSLSFDPRGRYDYLAAGEQELLPFTYVVSDGTLTDTATVTITITGVNDPPVASDDEYTTDEDTLLNVPAPGVLGNDDDLDTTDTLSVVDTSGTLGLVLVNADGSFSFDPRGRYDHLAAGEQEFFTFSYTASDGSLDDTAAVTITIDGVNDAPTISNILNQSTDAGVPAGPVPFTVGDADTPAGTLVLERGSSNTTLVPLANIVFGGTGENRTVTITPTAGMSGTAVITVTVSDGVASDYDTFVLAVAVNSPPEFTSTPVEVATVGVLYTYDVIAADADPEDVLTITAPVSATWLTLTRISTRTATLSGTPPSAGEVPIELHVTDGEASTTQAFTITVSSTVTEMRVYLPLVTKQP